jgi:hypothetical protein
MTMINTKYALWKAGYSTSTSLGSILTCFLFSSLTFIGPAFYDLATPKYDVIDFAERATRGGDGVPLPKVHTNNGNSSVSLIHILVS